MYQIKLTTTGYYENRIEFAQKAGAAWWHEAEKYRESNPRHFVFMREMAQGYYHTARATMDAMLDCDRRTK